MPLTLKPGTHKGAGPDLGSDGFVLLVDDEADIRTLVARILRERGYQVLAAADGEEALYYIARGTAVRFVLCNLRMPRMNGPSLYLCVGVACPSLAERFVFCTGDVISDNSRYFLMEAGRPCLAKPFEIDELEAMLQRYAASPPVRLNATAITRVQAILARRHRELAAAQMMCATAHSA